MEKSLGSTEIFTSNQGEKVKCASNGVECMGHNKGDISLSL